MIELLDEFLLHVECDRDVVIVELFIDVDVDVMCVAVECCVVVLFEVR